MTLFFKQAGHWTVHKFHIFSTDSQMQWHWVDVGENSSQFYSCYSCWFQLYYKTATYATVNDHELRNSLTNHEGLKIESTQIWIHCSLGSYWKVKEFHIKSTVGAVFMFDMSSWVYFCPFSHRVPCFLSHSYPLLLSRLALKHCVFLSLCFFISMFFLLPSWSISFDVLCCFSWHFCSHFVPSTLILCPPPAMRRSEQWFVYNFLLETGQE